MSTKSKIEWTGETWNPLAGCNEISPGCLHCYAAMGQKKYAGTTKKLPNGKIVWTGRINTDEEALTIPLKRKKPTTYFVNSMSDLFHEDVKIGFVASVFNVMAACPQHTFQVLTKRAERMSAAVRALPDIAFEYWPGDAAINCAIDAHTWPLPNVWLGVSVEDQKRADERIPHLLRTPAAVRFLSCEPLLGAIRLDPCHVPPFCGCDKKTHDDRIHWVICGGESGHGARPMNPNWVRSLRDQCVNAGVPFFFKQWGQWKPVPFEEDHWPESDTRFTFDKQTQVERVKDKKDAGRVLDGKIWDEMPKAPTHQENLEVLARPRCQPEGTTRRAPRASRRNNLVRPLRDVQGSEADLLREGRADQWRRLPDAENERASMKTIEQFESEINALMAQKREFEERQFREHVIPKMRDLVGKCSRYRNSYGTRDQWWMYVRVNLLTVDDVLHGIVISRDCNGKIIVTSETFCIPLSPGYEEITEAEFEAETRSIRMDIQAALDGVA